MPELPEVETLVRQLNRCLPGKTFKQIKVNTPKTVRPLSGPAFGRCLVGVKIKRVCRRAKIIIIELTDKQTLFIHLKMTGQLIFVPADGQTITGGHPQKPPSNSLPHKYTRAEFHFTDGSALYFNDLRKFGWLKLLDNKTGKNLLADHGPEPLSKKFTVPYLTELTKRYPQRMVKQILLDQKLIAGLGNIYADEACFGAKILPTRRNNTLTPKNLADLHHEIVKVLKLAINKKGTSVRDYVTGDGSPGGFVPYLNVYGREGEKCRRCAGQIKKIKLNGRGTHFCDRCQK
ncbi:MAG: bifunctional DNA-formamidopyrimidine glycosylase/DNA-(apurinic or apyrimidinic site) lyase [Candidatus Paceibacterota bacterium]